MSIFRYIDLFKRQLATSQESTQFDESLSEAECALPNDRAGTSHSGGASGTFAALEPSEISCLDELEEQLCFKDLMVFRAIGRREMKVEQAELAAEQQQQNPEKTTNVSAKEGWGSWAIRVAGAGARADSKSFPTAAGQTELGKTERAELYESIGYDESTAASLLPPEKLLLSVDIQLEVRL